MIHKLSLNIFIRESIESIIIDDFENSLLMIKNINFPNYFTM